MADARIEVAVSAEVQLVPDEKTRDWLISLGWTPPPVEAEQPERLRALTGAEAWELQQREAGL